MRRAALALALVACRGGGRRPAHDDAAPARPAATDAAASAPAPAPGPAVVERFDDAALGELPADVGDRDVAWSAHGAVAAWVMRAADGQAHAVVNGVVSPLAFDHVERIELARDGVTPIYVGNRGGTVDPTERVRFVRGGTEQVVVGELAGPVVDHALVLHDADEPHMPFVYLAYAGGGQRLYVEGRPGPLLDDIQIEHLSFLLDGTPTFRGKQGGASRVVIGDDVGPAYRDNSRPRVGLRAGAIAYMGQLDDGQHVFTGRDRTPGPAYDAIGELAISPDGVVAYEAERGGQTFAVVGGQELGPYDRAMRFGFGAGGKVAFVARRGERWFVVVDGQEGPPFGAITEPPVWSPDGAHVAYAGAADHLGPEAVIRDGRPAGPAREGVSFLRWSADGRHLAWTQRSGRAQQIAVDGVAGADFDRLGDAAFDGDGAVIYEGARGRQACLVRGAVETCHDDLGEPNLIAADEAVNFTMDPGRHHLAYRARTGGQWSVIVDGVAGPPADAIWPPIVSADGRRVGYGYRIGRALAWRSLAWP